MMFNEEVQRVLEDALLERKLTESILKFARPSELLGGSSEQIEYIQKLPVARSTERALVLVEQFL